MSTLEINADGRMKANQGSLIVDLSVANVELIGGLVNIEILIRHRLGWVL